jgi:hypothetical protein
MQLRDSSLVLTQSYRNASIYASQDNKFRKDGLELAPPDGRLSRGRRLLSGPSREAGGLTCDGP